MMTDTSLAPDKTYPPPMPIRVLRQGINVPQRQGLALGGAVLVALSLPVGLAAPSIPVALPMAAIGTVLLGVNAVWARRWLDDAFARHPGVARWAPDWLRAQVSGGTKQTAADRG